MPRQQHRGTVSSTTVLSLFCRDVCSVRHSTQLIDGEDLPAQANRGEHTMEHPCTATLLELGQGGASNKIRVHAPRWQRHV